MYLKQGEGLGTILHPVRCLRLGPDVTTRAIFVVVQGLVVVEKRIIPSVTRLFFRIVCAQGSDHVSFVRLQTYKTFEVCSNVDRSVIGNPLSPFFCKS